MFICDSRLFVNAVLFVLIDEIQNSFKFLFVCFKCFIMREAIYLKKKLELLKLNSGTSKK